MNLNKEEKTIKRNIKHSNEINEELQRINDNKNEDGNYNREDKDNIFKRRYNTFYY